MTKIMRHVPPAFFTIGGMASIIFENIAAAVLLGSMFIALAILCNAPDASFEIIKHIENASCPDKVEPKAEA